MMRIDCMSVEELLADARAGRLDTDAAEAMARHLEQCADCAATAELVDRMRRFPLATPPALEDRVFAALRSETELAATSSQPDWAQDIARGAARMQPLGSARLESSPPIPPDDPRAAAVREQRTSTSAQPFSSPSRPWWHAATRSRMVLAASVVLALLGGRLWLAERQPWSTAEGEAVWAYAQGWLSPFPVWPGSGAYLADAVVLGNLSDEELETLLAELDW